jgi:trimeric autotransporter adhesin
MRKLLSLVISVILLSVTFSCAALGPITGRSSVCVSATDTLSDSLSGGIWSASNGHATIGSSTGIVTGVTAGIDTISYYRGTTVTMVITINPLPSVITGGSTVAMGSTLYLSDSIGGGTWTSYYTSIASIGSTSGMVTGLAVGGDYIFYTLTTGCRRATSITVTAPTISGYSSVCVGSSITLTQSDSSASGVWRSSNTSIATVDSLTGSVLGVGGGVVTISYVVTGGYSLHTVTVNPTPTISGTLTVSVGGTTPLTASPSGGSWSIYPTSVATVSGGLVTGVSVGTAIVSYVSTSGCITTATVTVTSGLHNINGSSSLCVGSQITLTDSTSGGTWSSSNTSVATVGSSTGMVTGINSGVVIISYYHSGLVTKTITVNATPVITGGSSTCVGSYLSLSATPSGAWSSTATSIATVGSSGTVVGVSAGTVVIVCGSTAGCYGYDTVTVSSSRPISGGSTVCIGSTLSLTDSSGTGSWSSSSTSIATVGTSTGVVTGVATGVVTITYTSSGGCRSTHTVTVNTAPTISGGSTVCSGSSLSLTGYPTGGTWSSSSTSIATVGSTGLVSGASGGVVNIYYTSGGCTAYHTVTVNTSATITGASTVCVGSTTSFTASPSGGTWSSSSSTTASITTAGVVTGVAAGTATIYYSYAGCYSSKSITVNAIPATITGTTTVTVGHTITLSDATGGGSWSSSSTSIATVSSTGVVTGIAAGTAGIIYTVGGCSTYIYVTVTNPVVLSAITGASTTCIGSSTTFTDSVSGGTWSSSNTAIATVSTAGVVTGVSAGTATITYSLGTSYVTKSITIVATPTITGSSSVCPGSYITLSASVSGGTWVSGNTAIATVTSSGVVSGVSIGTVNIYYSYGSCYAYHTVTVNGLSAISGSSTVCSGLTITLSDSTSGGTWSSGSSSIATVGSTGVVTGVSAGVTTITYSHGGCATTKTVTVNTATHISGPTSVCAGSSVTLTGTPSGGSWISGSTSFATISSSGVLTGVSGGITDVYYSLGGCYANQIDTVYSAPAAISGTTTVTIGGTTTLSDASYGGTWSSSNTAIATVSSSGVVTGVSAGTCGIIYTVGSCYVYVYVTVSGTSTHISSISGGTILCTGSTLTLTDSTTGGSWSSSNTAIATVSSAGVVTGVSAGSVTITYTVGSGYVTHSITVNPASSISGSSSLCIGSTTTLTGSPSGGSWSSSNTSIATVSSAGVVTAVSSGVVNIYYNAGGCYSYHTVTVNASPSTIIGYSTVSVGSTITLSDSVSGGSWSSSNTSIATVSSTGVVTGVSAGTVNITYSIGGCMIYKTITVTGSTTSISAISGGSTVCVGSTVTLSDSTSGGSWSSSNTAIATVSSIGVVTGVSAGTVTITYTVGSSYVTHTITVNPASSISGSSLLCVSTSTALTGSPAGGAWYSSNSAVGSVTSAGVVIGESAGTVTIYYNGGGCYSTHAMTINPEPTAISGATTVAVGHTITMTDGTSGGSWSSSNTAIATVSTAGVVTGVSAGTCGIIYTVGGCSVYVYVTVTGSTTTISSITGGTSVCVGSTMGVYDSTSGGSWSSSNTAIATVSSTGVVTGVSAGTVTITYTVGSSYVTHTISVNPLPSTITGTTSVAVGSTTALSDATSGGTWSSSNTAIATVSSTGVVTGVSTGTVGIIYTVGGCYVYTYVTVTGTTTHVASISGSTSVCLGSTTTFTDSTSGGTWSSSNTAIATVSTAGVITGVSAGTATITYTVGSSYVTKSITITAAATITGSSSLCIGGTATLFASVSGGTWSSGGTSIATVSTAGLVTAVAAGTVNIYYLVSGCYAYHTVTVNAAASITGSSALCSGATTSLSSSISGGSWTSGNTSIATVSTGGSVTGIGSGVVNIYYSAGSCYAYHTVTVSVVSAITGTSAICSGASTTLSDATSGGTWSSSSSSVATVTSTGGVTGVSAGTVTISYATAACVATKVVTINPAPSTISGSSTVGVGHTITLTDATGGGTWSSSSSSIASVGASTGIVTGVSAGTINIYYMIGSCAAYKPITVTGTPSTPAGAMAKTESFEGTSELSDAATVKVYPNPTSGTLNISWDGQTTGTATVILADVTGRSVYNAQIEIQAASGLTQINLPQLKDGIYILSVKSESMDYTAKVIIQK